MTTRRGFLGAILAAGVAPAFVGSGVLMPVRQIIVPPDPYAAASARFAASLQASIRHAGLRLGDMITIAGMEAGDGTLRQFRVTAMPSGGVIRLQAG